jgi:hypothetical protein
MEKLIKNRTYLGKRDGKWWIIHQTGQRSWTACVFTHIQTLRDGDECVITDNGTNMSTHFTDLTGYGDGHTPRQQVMRERMFNILKWGSYEEPEQEGNPIDLQKEVP